MTIRLSAGLLHEYLAGRLDAARFREKAFGNTKNLFDLEFTRGHSIRNVQLESREIDEDHDYVLFDLDVDWQKIAKKYETSQSQDKE